MTVVIIAILITVVNKHRLARHFAQKKDLALLIPVLAFNSTRYST